jgi:transglutaminase-like putative cysteine protease
MTFSSAAFNRTLNLIIHRLMKRTHCKHKPQTSGLVGAGFRVLVLTLGSQLLLGNAAPSRQIIHGTDTFEVTYKVKLPEMKNDGRLWVPLAKSDPYQSVQIESLSMPTNWQVLQDQSRENLILTLPTDPRLSGQEMEIKYAVKRLEKSVYRATEKDIERHLRPERLVPANRTFKEIARKQIQGKRGDLERGRALYQHTLDRMKYDQSGTGWGRGDALYACDSGTGNCTDFHAYFIALCRAVNIPARFAIGLTIPADEDEGRISGYHCWAEFFADGKWVPVDISEADKHPELADYYFGHHPANRFEFSAGRDLVVNPAPKSGPINFLVYPLLEVGGQVAQAQFEFDFRRAKQPQ